MSAACGQAFPGANPTYNGDPSLAKIVQEQRFNVGNEKFGHAAEQEDGVILQEQSDGNNNRIGQYQYIGDDGKTYTVKYEAGVNGFRSDSQWINRFVHRKLNQSGHG